MKKNPSEFLQNLPYFLMIIAFSVIPFWKTGSSGLMERTDADFPLLPVQNFYSQLHVWYDKVALGYDISAATLSQIPFYGFIALLAKLGLSTPLIERVWFVLGLALAGISLFSLAKHISGNKNGSLLAAFLFIYNPFMIFQLSQGEHITIFSFALVPAALLCAIKGIERKIHLYALGIGLLSVLMAITNVPNLAVALLPIIFYLLFDLFLHRECRKFTLKFALLSVLSMLILNLWWLIPGFVNISGGSQASDITRMWLVTWQMISLSSNFFHSLTITGIPGYVVGSLLALSVLLAGILVVSILVSFDEKSKARNYLLFGLMLLGLSLLLAVGNRGIWGNIQQLLMTKISILQMFRNPYRFAGITLLAYSILLAICWPYLMSGIKKSQEYFWLVVGLSLIIAGTHPLLSGNLKGYLEPINIPEEYYQLSDELNSKPYTDNILILPQEEWLTKYKWTNYDLPDFSRYMFNNPILRFYPENRLANNDAINLLYSTYNYLEDNKGDKLAVLARMLNAKYILLHKDLDPFNDLEANIVNDPATLERTMSRQKDVRLIKNNDYFQLYEVDNPSPTVFVSNKIEVVPYKYSNNIINVYRRTMCIQSYEDFFKLINSKPDNDQPLYYFDEDGQVPAVLKKLKPDQPLPVISYKKISPTRYRVSISNATAPFTLTLSQSYNKNWALSQNGKFLAPEQHLKLNNYANSWYLEKQGNYSVEILYKPQSIIEKLLFSSLTLAVLLIILIVGVSLKNAKKVKG